MNLKSVLQILLLSAAWGISFLLPLWGVFWGWIAGEAVGMTTCLGVAITVAGLVLLNLRARAVAPAETAFNARS